MTQGLLVDLRDELVLPKRLRDAWQPLVDEAAARMTETRLADVQRALLKLFFGLLES